MNKKINEKFKHLMHDKKLLMEFKFWAVVVMIIAFGFVTQIMINRSMVEYVVACGGLLIVDMLIYKLLDTQVQILIMDEVIKFNAENQVNIRNVQSGFDELVKQEQQIHRIAAKYERCWSLLKLGCKMSNNTALGNYLDKLEKSVEPEIDEQMNKIYKKFEG